MATQRFRIALNNARFPFVSTWEPRSVVVQSADTSVRQPNSWQGSPENVDTNLSRVIYGENFVPVANGLKSVSYSRIVDGIAATDFDQIFPLRDADENTVLFSPSHGQNYVLDPVTGWAAQQIEDVLTAIGYSITDGDYLTARVTRAYVEGYTFVCYARLEGDAGGATRDLSVFVWDAATQTIKSRLDPSMTGIISNFAYNVGTIDGVAASNGYLLLWSGISVSWAPFNGVGFDFSVYANGEVTGAGNQIPEDIKGPITAITPVPRGFIIWTTKNAVAAIYNSNNFASPWIFAEIQNCGGVESFEQVAEGAGGKGAVYAYTTSGMQAVSLNAAENVFPDASDFLGARFIERFNPENFTFEAGFTSLEMFVKVTVCSQRFLVLSYGTYPGIYGFALIYDTVLERWGKLRVIHRDCFAYSYGSLPAELTYSMLGDVPYETFDAIAYEDMTISGGVLTYPRQSIAFMLETGEISLAVMDEREAISSDYPSFVILGKNQYSRSKLLSLVTIELEGAGSAAQVVALLSDSGASFSRYAAGVLRESSEFASEWGFDLPTAKNFAVLVLGQFHLSTCILETVNDGSL